MIIVDASVVVKWVNQNEKHYEKALLLYNSHLSNREKIFVPGLLFIEVANALVTKSDFLPQEVKTALSFIFKADLSVYEVAEKDIFQASIEAKKYKTSVYDMLYAVVAQRHNTILITADERFVRKTKFSYVKLLTSVV